MVTTKPGGQKVRNIIFGEHLRPADLLSIFLGESRGILNPERKVPDKVPGIRLDSIETGLGIWTDCIAPDERLAIELSSSFAARISRSWQFSPEALVRRCRSRSTWKEPWSLDRGQGVTTWKKDSCLFRCFVEILLAHFLLGPVLALACSVNMHLTFTSCWLIVILWEIEAPVF